MAHTILLLESVHPHAMKLLEDADDVKVITAFESASVADSVSENKIDAIITRGKGQVNTELIDSCKDLKIIARCGVGLDNINVEEATRRGIKVVNAPNSNAATIAEHTVALMLILQRNLFNAINTVKQGNWEWRSQYKGDEVNGKTLGIVGYGNIGMKVAAIGAALGLKIIYSNKTKKDVPYTYMSLDDLLEKADIVTLHLPLTDDTKHLINERTLGKMKPTALLINTARGKIIDQKALLNALEKNQLAGFAADVMAEEPPAVDEPLINHPNTIITAHIGSLTHTTYREMCFITVKNTLAILRGEEPMKGCIFNAIS